LSSSSDPSSSSSSSTSAKPEQVFQRYCHVYCKGELESLAKQISSLKVVDSYYDKGNWCLVVQKVQ
jgi:alkylated DNA repair protein alkB family protein 8